RRHTSFSRDWSSDVCSSDLPSLIPPARSSSNSRMGVPSGSSQQPGFFTRPLTPQSLVPASAPTPSPLYQSTPNSTMPRRLQIVSTLFTMVGLPHSPLTCGKGGLALGLARLPSSALSSAVSSPQM